MPHENQVIMVCYYLRCVYYQCGMVWLIMSLKIDQVSPDPSPLSRFRSMTTKSKAYESLYESLFKEINKELETNQINVKTGAIVDASAIATPWKPKGKTNYQVRGDRKDEHEVVTKAFSDGLDKAAA